MGAAEAHRHVRRAKHRWERRRTVGDEAGRVAVPLEAGVPRQRRAAAWLQCEGEEM